MLDNFRLQLYTRLCRVLPPSLAYRLDFALLSDLKRKAIPFDAQALFGRARLSGSMDCPVEAQFALHGSCNYLGLVAARAVCGPGDCILEVGANVGTETLSLADVVGSAGALIAVEPMHDNFLVLCERIGANALDQVRPVQCAIVRTPGEVHMQPQHHHGLAYVSSEAGQASVTVRGVTMDDLCGEHGMPAFIWMDIEGHELQALRSGAGVLAQARPVIFSEVDARYLQRAGDSIEALLEFVQGCGYVAFDAQLRGMPPVRNAAQLAENHHSDWLLLPRESEGRLAPRLRWLLRRARFLPRVRGLSPIG